MTTNTRFRSMVRGFAPGILGLTLAIAGAQAQDVSETLFAEAKQAMQQATDVQADVLAPKSFADGSKYFSDAEADYKRGKNLEDIRKSLRSATESFNEAIEATKLAQVTFVPSIKARSAALDADAPGFAKAGWDSAETKFSDAARQLENGDVNGAKKRSAEAESLYRQAELDAIKANYLQETWQLLGTADKQKVKETAPVTLAKAQSLIAQAEKELSENRYDTDVARNLAQQAKYEAKHALYLDGVVKEAKKQKKTTEDLLLAAEEPLQRLASSMDMVARFDAGPDEPTDRMIEHVKSCQDDVAKQADDLDFRAKTAANLEERVAELEAQLGDAAQQRSELQERMDAEEKAQERFKAVEKMFPKEQARVLREGDRVIMRLIGLNFASGKSNIEPQYFGLLTTVQTAISTFPGSKVDVQGHTDSFGGDELNLELSQQRADAVRQYLLANMRELTPEDVKAVGFGESQPIANNETEEGRTKNRRIDIVIDPRTAGQ